MRLPGVVDGHRRKLNALLSEALVPLADVKVPFRLFCLDVRCFDYRPPLLNIVLVKRPYPSRRALLVRWDFQTQVEEQSAYRRTIAIRGRGCMERRHASLVRLDVCELDYLGPLLYVIRDTLAEVGWRAR